MLLMLRADLETGRGDFAAARGHIDAALETLRDDRGLGVFDIYLAELALWERRWADAAVAAREAARRAAHGETAQLRVWFCAKALRAQAELAAVARARRDTEAERCVLDESDELIAAARLAAQKAAPVTPNGGGWLALAEAEYQRTRGVARPDLWAAAVDGWTRLDRLPLAAYCSWRHAEALAETGAGRAEASGPLATAYSIATRIGAEPMRHELELLAARARLDLTGPPTAPKPPEGLGEVLGLTSREAEVLTLLARGYTNREIAATLVISVRTVGVHVSHILDKLGAPNRLEAAAIAHRLADRS